MSQSFVRSLMSPFSPWIDRLLGTQDVVERDHHKVARMRHGTTSNRKGAKCAEVGYRWRYGLHGALHLNTGRFYCARCGRSEWRWVKDKHGDKINYRRSDRLPTTNEAV